MQFGLSIVRRSVFVLLTVAIQQVIPWTTLWASDTNVFLVHDGLQGAGYTDKGVKAVRFNGDAHLLLGTNANNGCVLAIAVHHMEYVEDPTLRPVFRLVAYKPATHKIVATLIEFTELEHIFYRATHRGADHLIMHTYGVGMSGVDGANVDAIIDMTYKASATYNVPATPVRIAIRPLGTVKPAITPSFNVPSTVDEGLVLLSTDDPVHPVVQVDVVGAGVRPSVNCNVSLSSLALDFGTKTIGTTNTQPLILRNNGSSPCTISGMLLNGGSAFSVTAPVLLPYTLAPSNAVTITVQYAPLTNGSDSAVLRVTSTDPDSPQQYVDLSGFGTSTTPSAITASPGLLNFGSIQIGSNQTLGVTIVNSGGSTGHVTALTLAASTNFTVSPVGGFTLPPVSTQTVAVTYRPLDTSTATGTLEIINDNPDNRLTFVSLIATSNIPPICSIQSTPSSLNFGAVTNGGTRILPVSVSNNSLAPCTINSISYAGSSDFTNALAVTFPIALAPGAATNLSFSFSPTGGLTNGSATISASVGTSTNTTTIAYSGMGAAISANCAVSVIPTSLPFGNVAVGSTNIQKFVVSNTSATNCSISGLLLGGSADFIMDAPATPIQLPAGSQVELGVQYVPAGVGVDSGTLQVVTGDPLQPIVTVGLTGSGVEPAVGLSTNNLQFGQMTGGSNVTMNVWLTNPGGVNATIYSISLIGSLNFTLDPIVPRSRFELTNNASVIIPVTYVAPFYPSTDIGAVIISNNAPGSSLTVLLNGTSLQSVMSAALSRWAFGAVQIGETGKLTVAINNTGNTNGTIEAVEVAGSGRYAYSISPVAPISIGPGSSTSLDIEYIPANVRTLVIFGGAVTTAGKPSKVSP